MTGRGDGRGGSSPPGDGEAHRGAPNSEAHGGVANGEAHGGVANSDAHGGAPNSEAHGGEVHGGAPNSEAHDRGSAGRARGRAEEWRAQGPVLGAIALGGALGAPARYGVAQLIHVAPGTFPWATFWTNISGSFALGVILSLILERFPPTRYLRPFVTTGFLGAYTTYSTFAVESDLLIKGGHVAVAMAYIATSLVAGLSAVWAGIWAARAAPACLPRHRPGGGET